LRDEKNRPKLRLKNGNEVDAQSAYVEWRMLTAHQANSSQDLQALIAIARNEAIPADLHDKLRKEDLTWFDDNGNLSPLVRDVLLSAVRDSPDGTVLVNPFDLTKEADARLLYRIEQRYLQRLKQMFRGGGQSPGSASR
jgi:hypothetical protein